MGLNVYRDEVAVFLENVDTREKPSSFAMDMLDNEIALLINSLNDRERLKHQIYDVLFLIFEIAAIHNTDLDYEWTQGRIRKRTKYLKPTEQMES